MLSHVNTIVLITRLVKSTGDEVFASNLVQWEFNKWFIYASHDHLTHNGGEDVACKC